MKKKWLVGFLSAALAFTLSFGLAACGGDGDENETSGMTDQDKATTAINVVKSMYESVAVDTVRDYEVIGQARAGTEAIPITWTVGSATETELSKYVSVGTMDETTKLVKISVSPDAEKDVEYVLRATATVNDASANVSFTHRVPHNPIIGCDEQFDFAGLTGVGVSLNAATTLNAFKASGLEGSGLVEVAEASSVYEGNTSGGAYQNQGGFLRLGTSSNNGKITLVFSKKVSSVTVLAQAWSATSGDKITVNGAEAVEAGSDAPEAITFALETPTETVTIETVNKSETSSSRLFLLGVGATYATGVHNHVWSYTHIEGTFKHKEVCTAEGCDDGSDVEKEVDCTPNRNVCKCGYTYKEEEILNAFFALASKKSLPGTYELTGTITSIVEIQTGDFKNATFYMKVGSFHEFEVYRASGDGYENIKPGDTVTVYGELTNYNGTFEFTQGGVISKIVDNSSTMTNQQKADFAKDVLSLSKTMLLEQNESIELPTTGIYGSTIAWEVATNEYVEKSGNSLVAKKLPAEGEVSVTVTATVTVGDKTATKEFTITVQAPLVLEGEGTQGKPFTAEDVKNIGSRLGEDAYYQEAGSTARVYVEGYIAAVGTLTEYNGIVYAQNVRITSLEGDYQAAVYRFYFATGILAAPAAKTDANPLHVGDYVVVYGYIQNYKGNTIQVTYSGSTNPTITAYTAASGLTNAEKAALAIKGYALEDRNFNTLGENDLPATEPTFNAALTWGVKDAENGYVSVAENKLSITKLPTEGEVKVILTVTATVGTGADAKTSSPKEIEITLTPEGQAAKGTAKENPYSVTEALEEVRKITAGTGADSYSSDRFYVKGYVVDFGSPWDGSNNNWYRVYIADSKDSTKNSADAIVVYKLFPKDTHELLTLEHDLVEGAEIIVYGYFQNYKSSGNATPEINSKDSVNIEVVSYTDPRTAQQKAEQAIEWAKAAIGTEVPAIVSEIDLPASTISGITLAYTASVGTVANDKLTVVHGASASEITLTINATGAATLMDTVTLSVAAGVTIEDGDRTYNFDEVELPDGNAQQISAEELLTVLNAQTDPAIIISATPSYVYKGNSSGGPAAGGKLLKFGNSNGGGTITLTFAKAVNKIVIDCAAWGASETGLTVNGMTKQMGTTKGNVTFTFEPTTEVTITTTKRAIVWGFTVTVSNAAKSDADKLQDAKDALILANTTLANINDFIDLPATGAEGATISWSVSPETNAKVEGTKLVLKTAPTAETTVTLTAHIECGAASGDKTFEITLLVPAVLEGQGTQDDPYTVEDAIAIGKTLTNDGDLYSVGGEAVMIHVKGYITDPGKTYTGSGRDIMSSVYIADTKDGTTTLLLYSIGWNEIVAKPASGTPLHKGDYIVVYGYLKLFGSGNSAKLEMDKANDVDPVIKVWTKAELTNTDKAKDVLAEIEEPAKVQFLAADLNEELTLDTETTLSVQYEATILWDVEASLKSYITVANGKLTVTALPDGEAVTGKLTVTVTVGDGEDAATATKDFDVTVNPADVEELGPQVLQAVDAAPESGDYYLGMKIGYQWYYITGSESGNYLATTTNVANAAEVTITKNGEDYTLQVKSNSKYIEVIKSTSSGKTYYNAKLPTAQTEGQVWKWNDQYKIFTMDVEGTDYYLGTYTNNGSTYTTMSASAVTYAGNATSYLAKVGQLANGGDEDKAFDVLSSIQKDDLFKLENTVFSEENTTGVDLPTSDKYGATITWTVKNASEQGVVNVENNMLKILKLATTTDAEITLEVSVQVGEETLTAELKIFVETAAPAAPDSPTEATVKLSEYGEAHGWNSSSANKTLEVDNNIEVTLEASDSNTGKLYGDGWRIYQSGAAKITFAAKNDATIYSIEITYSRESNGILTSEAGKTIVSKKIVYVQGESYTFAVANNILGGTGGQVRISEIKVTYTGGATLTDEDIAQGALDLIDVKVTELTEDLVLPTTTVEGVTLNWKITSTDPAPDAAAAAAAAAKIEEIDGGGYKITVTPQADDVTIILTLSASYNGKDAPTPKTFTIVIIAVLTDLEPGASSSITWESSKQGVTTNGTKFTLPFTVKHVTFSLSGSGTAPAYYDTGKEVRFYKTTTLTISVPEGYKITNITITTNGDFGGSATQGSFDSDTKIWTGSEQSVEFAFTATTKIQKFEITYQRDAAAATAISAPVADLPHKD